VNKQNAKNLPKENPLHRMLSAIKHPEVITLLEVICSTEHRHEALIPDLPLPPLNVFNQSLWLLWNVHIYVDVVILDNSQKMPQLHLQSTLDNAMKIP